MKSQIDLMLNGIGENLQLNPSRRARVETSYRAVSEWLAADDELFGEDVDLEIYPQGSYRIETTVKPIKGNEYDLDFVLEIQEPWKGSRDPVELLDKIMSRMLDNETYKGKVERKNRCVRINYENDFHMDILPGYPYLYVGNTDIMVPDCKTEGWKDSAPKGYAIWFEKRCQTADVLLEKMAAVEPLPEETPFEMKPPLKRAVQLIKRYRDIYFENNPDDAPISIVLTTLAAENYHGETSVFIALKNILSGIKFKVESCSGVIEVWNPANTDEKLSERWDGNIKLYKIFTEFIISFSKKWAQLESMLGYGLDIVKKELQEMFGESVAVEVFEKYAAFYSKHREKGNLGVSTSDGHLITGIAASTATGIISVPRNTFYGD